MGSKKINMQGDIHKKLLKKVFLQYFTKKIVKKVYFF